MSASREKKARKDGVTPDLVQQQETVLQEQKAKTKKNILIGIAITLAVVLLIGSIVLFRGPYFTKNSIAVSTGDHELAPITVRYFYMDAYNSLYQSYGSMFSVIFPESGNIDEQIYDSTTGQTWGDVLMDSALEEIRGTYAIYDEAIANGYVLSEEGEQAVENNKAIIELYAEAGGFTPDGYLRQMYGSGASMETYLEYQKILSVAAYYQLEQQNTFTYSEEELAEAYEADPNAFDKYTYHTYLVNAESETEEGEEETEADKEAAMAAAKELAEEMAKESKGSIETYLQYCDQISDTDAYSTTGSTIRENTSSGSLSETIYDWITDPARQNGDTGVVELENSGYYVLYFVSRDTNDYDALNVRSIKISSELTADDGTTTTSWDAADLQLNFFKAEMEAYENKAEGFDALASLYSTDENTKNYGGAYETVCKGQFEDAVDEWLFEEGRAVGDYTVIKGEDAYYAVYVEDIAGNYRDYLVDTSLRSADFSAWVDSVIADATLEQNEAGMELVDRTIALQYSAQ